MLDRLAHELHNRGELASTYDDLGFAERLIRIYRETGRDHSRYFDPSLLTSGVTPDTPFWARPSVFRDVILMHKHTIHGSLPKRHRPCVEEFYNQFDCRFAYQDACRP